MSENNKPLKDWTLGEVQEECKRRDAPCASSGCQFYGKQGLSHCCKLQDLPPEAWDLSDTPKLTPDEQAVCRLLKSGGASQVTVFGNGSVSYFIGDNMYGCPISRTLFPSLRPGDELNLTTMDLKEEQ